MIMMITSENYEIFVLDYLEGKLEPEMNLAFRLFLDGNPEIREEIESFEMVKLVSADVEYPDKESLKRRTGDLLNEIPVFERSCIAHLEKDQTDLESIAFKEELFLDPEKQKVYEEFGKTILKPVPVSFDSKNALKKPVPEQRTMRLLVWYAAASVILLFLLTNPFKNSIQQNIGSAQSDNTGIVAEFSGNTEGKGTSLSEAIPVQSYTAMEKTSPEGQSEHKDISIKVYPISEVQPSITEVQHEQNNILALQSLSGPLPAGKMKSLSLKTPLIYIPVYLEAEDLKALEALTLVDFKVKVIQEPKEEKKAVSFLLSLFSSGIKSLNKTTGSSIEMETSLNENGKLTAFVFNSANLKIRTTGKEKTAIISPVP